MGLGGTVDPEGSDWGGVDAPAAPVVAPDPREAARTARMLALARVLQAKAAPKPTKPPVSVAVLARALLRPPAR